MIRVLGAKPVGKAGQSVTPNTHIHIVWRCSCITHVNFVESFREFTTCEKQAKIELTDMC
jgi:hypothetical protein